MKPTPENSRLATALRDGMGWDILPAVELEQSVQRVQWDRKEWKEILDPRELRGLKVSKEFRDLLDRLASKGFKGFRVSKEMRGLLDRRASKGFKGFKE
jgi:hypothetical protein